jgi:hypothetical protein
MERKAYFIAVLYLIWGVSGSLYGIGEKTIRLGGDSIWKMLDYRAGISEMPQVRPGPVLALSSTRNPAIYGLDLSLSFDEGNPVHFQDTAGHYRITISPSLAIAVDHQARAGFGSALFQSVLPGVVPEGKTATSGPLVIEARNTAALLAPHNRIYDFAMEFWMYPFNMENGEQILQWTASTKSASQRILCVASKNRLHWSFYNFFTSPDGAHRINIDIDGVSAVVPKTWSHHLVRFDSHTGMVEYLVNGKTECIEYATATKREGGEVYTPLAGEGGRFVLGEVFSGMMDEFRVHGAQISGSGTQKYPLNGGRIETRALDLGNGSNGILKIEASGGKVSTVNARINNEFRRNGRFRFSDDSEMQFFIRCSDNPYQWSNPWQAVIPGAELSGTVKGRYVQLAVDFYPSASGESSPYLEEISITYLPDEPPLPPAQLIAVAMDGAVQLRWRSSPDLKTQGYLVYYGTSSDDYFGEDATMGVSPINVGKQNEIRIDGLRNGTLYYFRVAAYSLRDTANPFQATPFHAGEFSREVRARPLMLAGN